MISPEDTAVGSTSIPEGYQEEISHNDFTDISPEELLEVVDSKEQPSWGGYLPPPTSDFRDHKHQRNVLGHSLQGPSTERELVSRGKGGENKLAWAEINKVGLVDPDKDGQPNNHHVLIKMDNLTMKAQVNRHRGTRVPLHQEAEQSSIGQKGIIWAWKPSTFMGCWTWR